MRCVWALEIYSRSLWWFFSSSCMFIFSIKLHDYLLATATAHAIEQSYQISTESKKCTKMNLNLKMKKHNWYCNGKAIDIADIGKRKIVKGHKQNRNCNVPNWIFGQFKFLATTKKKPKFSVIFFKCMFTLFRKFLESFHSFFSLLFTWYLNNEMKTAVARNNWKQK